MTTRKPVTPLRKGDRIHLKPRDRIMANTDREHAEVLRISNTPYGLILECAWGITLHARRDEHVEVVR